MQVDSYVAFSKTKLFFNIVFTVIPPSTVPNARSRIILRRDEFINYTVHMEIPGIRIETCEDETIEDN